MLKNIAGQKCLLFAYNDTTGLPVIADEANITCEISLDGSQFSLAVNRATLSRVLNASGSGTGFYSLTLDIAETNANVVAVIGASVTPNVVIQGASFYTQMQVSDKTGYSISGTKQTLDALQDASVAGIQSGLATEANATANKNEVKAAIPSVSALATEANATANKNEVKAAIPSVSALATSAQVAALHDIQVSDIFAAVGLTAGGTWTFAKILKVLIAWNAGKWQSKVGVTGVYQILDPEDNTTVILEVTPSLESPQKVTVIA